MVVLFLSASDGSCVETVFRFIVSMSIAMEKKNSQLPIPVIFFYWSLWKITVNSRIWRCQKCSSFWLVKKLAEFYFLCWIVGIVLHLLQIIVLVSVWLFVSFSISWWTNKENVTLLVVQPSILSSSYFRLFQNINSIFLSEKNRLYSYKMVVTVIYNFKDENVGKWYLSCILQTLMFLLSLFWTGLCSYSFWQFQCQCRGGW